MSIFEDGSFSVSNPGQFGTPSFAPGISVSNLWGVNFVVSSNSLFVPIAEAQQIAFAVAFYLVTKGVNYTAPVSGITVVSDGASGVNITVPGSSAVLLSPSQAQTFANIVGRAAACYDSGFPSQY